MEELIEEHKECGRTVRSYVMDIFKNISPGADILELAQSVDSSVIKSKDYKLLCPTTIDLNYIVQYCSPSTSYKIDGTDIVSYCVSLAKKLPKKYGKEMYAHAKMAFTKSINPRYEELCKVTSEACAAGVKNCGVDVPLSDLRHDISEILYSGGYHTITNVCGNELYNAFKIVPNSKIIPEVLRSNFDLVNGRMKEDEVYFIDVYGTDTSIDVEAKHFDYPSIFYRIPNKKTAHRKSVASANRFVEKTYGDDLFGIYDFSKRFDEQSKDVKMNGSILKSMVQGGYITSVPCLMIHSEDKTSINVVARFGHSIHIGAEKNTILC